MRYAEEEIEKLRDRWKKPLLKPGSFTRDKNGKVTLTDEYKDSPETAVQRKPRQMPFHVCLSDFFSDTQLAAQEELEKFVSEREISRIETPDQYLDFLDHLWDNYTEKELEKTINFLWDCGLDMMIDPSELDGITNRGFTIDFRGAFLSQHSLDGWDLRYANLQGARCHDTGFDFSDCYEADFSYAILERSSFIKATCYRAKFHFADCRECDFNETVLTNADLSNAVFWFCSFREKTIYKLKDPFVAESAHLDYVNYDEASFERVDTRDIDWSKNPRMKRYIEQQQYVLSEKMGIDEKFGKRKITKPIGRGIKKLVSIIDYLSDPLNWFMYGVATIAIFAIINCFCFGAIKYANDVNWFTPIYYSVVTFSTLGFGDIAPLTWYSQLFAVVEVITGYVFLGGLVTFLANWLGRR